MTWNRPHSPQAPTALVEANPPPRTPRTCRRLRAWLLCPHSRLYDATSGVIRALSADGKETRSRRSSAWTTGTVTCHCRQSATSSSGDAAPGCRSHHRDDTRHSVLGRHGEGSLRHYSGQLGLDGRVRQPRCGLLPKHHPGPAASIRRARPAPDDVRPRLLRRRAPHPVTERQRLDDSRREQRVPERQRVARHRLQSHPRAAPESNGWTISGSASEAWRCHGRAAANGSPQRGRGPDGRRDAEAGGPSPRRRPSPGPARSPRLGTRPPAARRRYGHWYAHRSRTAATPSWAACCSPRESSRGGPAPATRGPAVRPAC